MAAYPTMPLGIRRIWETTGDDIIICNLTRQNEVLFCKVNKHERILKDLLGYVIDGRVGAPRKIQDYLNTKANNLSGKIVSEVVEETRS